VSVVVGEGLDCFCEARRRLRVDRVDWEERIVEAWMLRWALRERTAGVRHVVRGRKEGGVYFVLGGPRSRCLAARRWDLRGWNHPLRES
jgi:hypothetical protein